MNDPNSTLTPDNVVWVICGDWQEFLDYMPKAARNSEYQGKKFQYVPNAHALVGLQKPHGVCVGTWKERNDILEIMSQLWIAHNYEGDVVRDLYQQAIDYQKEK